MRVRALDVGQGDSLLVDMGSTTTDLIPLHDGAVTAKGYTDTQRLASDELLYIGVRRITRAALNHSAGPAQRPPEHSAGDRCGQRPAR